MQNINICDYLPISEQVDRAPVTETVDLGLIPGRIITQTKKLMF